ncbi:AfsR/SARP family transcriptional regulator [Streptosporangium roseum]|uniref:AfsR/SARP family transcriptional regulator n=1 Tax=Streptosporangium roseum TaxID=2001 RepID=UPI00068C07DA|nr:AfsR/SARP family transcriptional regulator [Streptosporangium roseum]
MEFRVLGRLEVRHGEWCIGISAPKQRALLATLLCRANEAVSRDHLIDALWGGRPPRSAGDNLRIYVHHLRRILGEEDRIVRHIYGYTLDVRPGELDADNFREMADRGLAAGAANDPAAASRLFGGALALWRGETSFADVPRHGTVSAMANMLDERREVVAGARIEAEFLLGRSGELVGELRRLVTANPLREKPYAQLMLALYRDGRRAEALQVYRNARQVLIEDLGLEPGPELRALEAAILKGDAALLSTPGSQRTLSGPLLT